MIIWNRVSKTNKQKRYSYTSFVYYLPFGQAWQNPAMQTGTNRYLYNGKEAQTTGGLSFLDYGARFYSSRHGRWFNLDPLAENSLWMTPFGYAGNNPIKYIDLDGKIGILMKKRKKTKMEIK